LVLPPWSRNIDREPLFLLLHADAAAQVFKGVVVDGGKVSDGFLATAS